MKQRFSKRTRLVSALLTLAMVFTFLPFSAFAANTEIDFNSPDFKLNFPDEEFRRFLKECCDKNGDGKLDVDIKNMTIPTSYAIKSLEGIRFFEDLEKLDCHGIGLTTLNVGKNFKLKELDCSQNQLKKSVDILSSGLKKLNCSNNKLTYMNLGILYVSHLKDLVTLDCSHNDLEQLDVRNSKFLETLYCSSNRLTELDADVTHKSRLVSVECQNNQLTSLILGQNKLLKKLNCANNQLTQLNLNNMISLTELNCANNQLTVLDVSSSPNLTTLWLKNNHLTSLNLDNNPNLNFTYTDVYHSDFNNVYTVTLNPDRTFDLSTLPGGFDINRVTEWVNGTVKGNILTVNEGINVVYYGYQCRSNMLDVSFTLDVTGTGGTVPPVTPPSGGDNPGGGSTPGGSTPGGGSTGGGDGGGAVVIVAAVGAVAAGVVGYGVYNYVSGRKLQALLPEGVAAPENRAQTALLLWNTAGRPEPADAPAFADVADPDTAKAAQWCVEQGLMKRRLNGKFAPGSSIPAYQVLNAYRKLAG